MSTRNNRRRWLTLLLLPLLWSLLHRLFRPHPATRPKLIAHRGAAGLAPENTLLAIHEGLMHRADFIEIDIRRAADGEFVLMHDATVDRTTNGSGAVAELPWPALNRLDAGSHFSVRHTHELVPSLTEVLDLLKNETTPLLIEVKTADPEAIPALVQLIRQAGMAQRVLIASFSHVWVADFHHHAPDISVGLFSIWPLSRPRLLSATMVGVAWPAVLLDPTLVHRMHAAGHLVYAYPVNQPRIMRWLLALGVDGLITDRPDLWPGIVESGSNQVD